ncbi:MAG: glycoside hydrolase family 3 C-terminal domain-containing protein [Acholeplasmataceae bacterium]
MNKDKLSFTEGLNQWETKPLFGLDRLFFADGPHGLRKQLKMNDSMGQFNSHIATSFPTASLTSCSFDRALIKQMATLIAKEAKALNVHVVLGPGINIKRSPLCGRNFEYFSEDPLLSGLMGASFIRGLEDEGVGASVKHFFANNQEQYRYTINSVIDKRALREIYLKPFELALKEKPATMMTSYNKVNGIYTNEHPILKDIVRNEWGYEGVLVSDWGAINDKLSSLKASHDLEMPSSLGFFNRFVEPHLEDESLIECLNQTKERLTSLVKKYKVDYDQTIDFEAHHQAARHIARESMVLLKNEAILPFKDDESILITGPFCFDMRYQGSGSSLVNPYKVETFSSIASNYSKHIRVSKGITFESDTIIDNTLELAKSAHKIVVVIGLPDAYEQEGFDREHLFIPINQIHFINELYKVNQNIVLVVVGGGIIDLSVDELAKGVLLASLSGGAGVSAIMDILYGYSPSGRLSETYINKLTDSNISLSSDNSSVYYDESIFVGYRYFDTFNIDVKYPFGYGLSYSEFSYETFFVSVDDGYLNVSFNLKNSGSYDAKEVIQVYIGGPKSSVYKPTKELKYFDKVHLSSGEERKISIQIPLEDLRYFDIYQDRFILEDGLYKVYVSKNVRHCLFEQLIYIDGERVEHPKLSYLNQTYDTSSFSDIYHLTLPQKHIKHKRPFTINNTIDDLSSTFLGKMVSKKLIKMALKEIKDMPKKQQLLTKKMLNITPLRILALYGEDAFNLKMAQGIVDIVNHKFMKGLRKLR